MVGYYFFNTEICITDSACRLYIRRKRRIITVMQSIGGFIRQKNAAKADVIMMSHGEYKNHAIKGRLLYRPAGGVRHTLETYSVEYPIPNIATEIIDTLVAGRKVCREIQVRHFELISCSCPALFFCGQKPDEAI